MQASITPLAVKQAGVTRSDLRGGLDGDVGGRVVDGVCGLVDPPPIRNGELEGAGRAGTRLHSGGVTLISSDDASLPGKLIRVKAGCNFGGGEGNGDGVSGGGHGVRHGRGP